MTRRQWTHSLPRFKGFPGRGGQGARDWGGQGERETRRGAQGEIDQVGRLGVEGEVVEGAHLLQAVLLSSPGHCL